MDVASTAIPIRARQPPAAGRGSLARCSRVPFAMACSCVCVSLARGGGKAGGLTTNAAAGAVGRAHTRRCRSIDRPAWPTCIARYHQCWVLRGRLSDLSMHASRCMHGDCRQIINIAVIKGSSRRPSRLVGHLVWSLLFNSSTVSAGVDLDTYARVVSLVIAKGKPQTNVVDRFPMLQPREYTVHSVLSPCPL